MYQKSDILDTVRMLQEENLDVRTVTMGINIFDCAGRSIESTTSPSFYQAKTG